MSQVVKLTVECEECDNTFVLAYHVKCEDTPRFCPFCASEFELPTDDDEEE